MWADYIHDPTIIVWNDCRSKFIFAGSTAAQSSTPLFAPYKGGHMGRFSIKKTSLEKNHVGLTSNQRSYTKTPKTPAAEKRKILESIQSRAGLNAAEKIEQTTKVEPVFEGLNDPKSNVELLELALAKAKKPM